MVAERHALLSFILWRNVSFSLLLVTIMIEIIRKWKMESFVKLVQHQSVRATRMACIIKSLSKIKCYEVYNTVHILSHCRLFYI